MPPGEDSHSTILLWNIKNLEFSTENRLDLLLIDIEGKLNAADVGGITGQTRQVIARDVLGGELPRAAHELTKTLRQALVVSVEADRPCGQSFEFVVSYQLT